MKTLCLSAGLLLISCSSNPVIHPVQPLTINKQFNFSYGNDKALETAFRQYAKTGKAPNIKTDGFERFAYSSQQQPIINCMPFQQTIITLEPGEKFTSITSGDPQNLSYMVAVSGSATGVETQQVLVKPGLAKMSTNLIIATDKRTYNILIVVGVKNSVTRNVAFWYPEDMEKHGVPEEKMPQLDLSQANFKYKISGDDPSWTPVRVLDDGKRTWIELPSSNTIPTLLVQTDSKEFVKYNQSYYAPYLVVEGVFHYAKLISGVGSNQVQVDITNQDYK